MTVLLGPADASNYRVKQGRYGERWYCDPLPACPIAPASEWVGPSISAVKPPFANKYVPMKAIAEMSNDEWLRLAGTDADTRYEAIKSHDKATSRVNMDRGTLVHIRAEDKLRGRVALPVDTFSKAAHEQAERFYPALDSFFDTYQPELVAAEVVCLHRTLNGVGYGGTADAILRIDGDLWLADWKSRNSDHGAYLEEAAQGGGYAGAEYMIVTGDDGQPQRVEVPKVAGILIVSIRTDGYQVYPIERDDAIEVFDAMHAWWVAQRDARDNKLIGKPWAPKIAAGGSPSPGTPSSEPPAAQTELRRRVGKLIEAGHEDVVRRRWPDGVPTLGNTLTDEQCARLAKALSTVEADVEAPFDPPPQPPIKRPTNPQPVVEVQPAEGKRLTAKRLAELGVMLGEVSDDRARILADIAAQAHKAGRSLSVSQKPHERRGLIAQALASWALSDASYDDLWLAAILVGTTEQTADSDKTLGALLSEFTIEQASRLAETFADLSAA